MEDLKEGTFSAMLKLSQATFDEWLNMCTELEFSFYVIYAEMNMFGVRVVYKEDKEQSSTCINVGIC